MVLITFGLGSGSHASPAFFVVAMPLSPWLVFRRTFNPADEGLGSPGR